MRKILRAQSSVMWDDFVYAASVIVFGIAVVVLIAAAVCVS